MLRVVSVALLAGSLLLSPQTAFSTPKKTKKAPVGQNNSDDVDVRPVSESGASAEKTQEDPQEQPSSAPTAAGENAGDAEKPVPSRARYLSAVAKLVTTHLRLTPALSPSDVRDWGLAEIEGDRSPELLFSWSRGTVAGGVAIVGKKAEALELKALMKLKDPVLQVQAIPLAGGRGRHLLVRAGADDPGGGARRRMLVLAWTPTGLKKIWEREDTDNIVGNTDLSTERRATLSEVRFQEGIGGRPGSLSVTVSRFRAPKGKGPESTIDCGSEIVRFVYDRATGKLQASGSQPAEAAPDRSGSSSPEPERVKKTADGEDATSRAGETGASESVHDRSGSKRRRAEPDQEKDPSPKEDGPSERETLDSIK